LDKVKLGHHLIAYIYCEFSLNNKYISIIL
jgi:hypothetical protein